MVLQIVLLAIVAVVFLVRLAFALHHRSRDNYRQG